MSTQGDAVHIEHRRSLYSVIVGKQGVDYALQIETLDWKSRAKASEIADKSATVLTFAPRGMSVDAFIALEEDPVVAEKIRMKESELEAVVETVQIENRPTLIQTNLPIFDWLAIKALLCKTITSISADSERRVLDQIKNHEMHGQGQVWLAQGLSYSQSPSCPFCDQLIASAATLITAYRDFFSTEYKSLRSIIVTLRLRIETEFSDRVIAGLEKLIDQNSVSAEFWARFCEIVAPEQPSRLGDILRMLRAETLALVDKKTATPLEKIEPDTPFIDAYAAFGILQIGLTRYNDSVTAANAIIAAKQRAVGVADVAAIRSSLSLLGAVKARQDPEARKACDELALAQLEKKAIESNKETVRSHLDTYTEKVIGRYENTINGLLDLFSTGFSITGTRHSYPGGLASSNYQILINKTAVDLGDAQTPLDKPSFRNTLSAGDKSTLALAFFLAQLAHDSDKATKIVVFDDPFNSQDGFRQDCTIQKILKCGQECQQVVILSHDAHFLKRLWERLSTRADEQKCLKLSRIGKYDTTICPWDVEEATRPRFSADVKILSDYCNQGIGDPQNVVQKIRPVLESHCKYVCPDLFLENDWLGTIISKIRNAGGANHLSSHCEEHEGLNEYTKRYHHGEGQQSGDEMLVDAELQGFVKRTLEFTGSC
jgi:wobble nucleotide-excising tRNase